MAQINPTPDFDAMWQSVFEKLATDVASEAIAFFKSSFDKQGFTDSAFQKWPLRKDEEAHAILVKGENLKNSIAVVSQTIDRIEVGTNLPYAAIHNKGGKFSIIVTAKMRKFFWAMYHKTDKEKWKFMALTKKKRLPIRIPQRQFIGNSQVLDAQIDQLIMQRIKAAEQQFLKTL